MKPIYGGIFRTGSDMEKWLDSLCGRFERGRLAAWVNLTTAVRGVGWFEKGPEGRLPRPRRLEAWARRAAPRRFFVKTSSLPVSFSGLVLRLKFRFS